MAKNDRTRITDTMPDPADCHGHDYTCNGVCSECGACCTDCLDMSDEEIETIKEYISTHNVKPCNHIPVLATPGTSVDFLCPFLDTHKENHKCAIYDVRPVMCKTYICSTENIQTLLGRLSENDRKKFKEAVFPNGKRRPLINLGQTFFPDIYVPKKGDRAIMNKRYMAMQVQHANMVFNVMTDPDENNEVVIQWEGNPKLEYNFDVAGLTKLR